MISRYQEMVKEFHQAMGCEYGWGVKKLRMDLIHEEAGEVIVAIEKEDPIELIDGICDLLYVTYGAADLLGLEITSSRVETQPALTPPRGFEEIKYHLDEFKHAIEAVVAHIEAESKHMLAYYMTNLVKGCWIMAAEGLGLELAPFFEEVHRTNMLKLGGPVREDGKRLKPPGWTPPRIAEMYAKRKGMPVPEDIP